MLVLSACKLDTASAGCAEAASGGSRGVVYWTAVCCCPEISWLLFKQCRKPGAAHGYMTAGPRLAKLVRPHELPGAASFACTHLTIITIHHQYNSRGHHHQDVSGVFDSLSDEACQLQGCRPKRMGTTSSCQHLSRPHLIRPAWRMPSDVSLCLCILDPISTLPSGIRQLAMVRYLEASYTNHST